MLSFFRIIRFATQHFWRNIWLSLITISMLMLTLFTVNVLLVLNQLTETAIASVEEKIDVSVYFKPDTSTEKVQHAVGYLKGLSQVRDVEIITSEEALILFQEQHANDQVVLSSLEEIGENPFGATLIIKAHAAEDFNFILEALNNPQFSEYIREKDFSNYTDIISRIQTITDRIKWLGVGLSLLFLCISILIIFNTVRMNVFMYREEIGIMKLVGATNWFVRGPFFLEAFYYSVIAILITSTTSLALIHVFEPQLSRYFTGVETGLFLYFIENSFLIFGAELLGIFLLALFSTAFAMRKYLRV